MSDDFVTYRVGPEIYIAHRLPGELRIIAKIEQYVLDKQQQERYADMIVDALNNQPK